jgi:hypothetical protein
MISLAGTIAIGVTDLRWPFPTSIKARVMYTIFQLSQDLWIRTQRPHQLSLILPQLDIQEAVLSSSHVSSRDSSHPIAIQTQHFQHVLQGQVLLDGLLQRMPVQFSLF